MTHMVGGRAAWGRVELPLPCEYSVSSVYSVVPAAARSPRWLSFPVLGVRQNSDGWWFCGAFLLDYV